MKNKKMVYLVITIILIIASITYLGLNNSVNPKPLTVTTINEPMLEGRYSTFLNHYQTLGIKDGNETFNSILPTNFILQDHKELVEDSYEGKGLVYKFDDNSSISFNVFVTKPGLYHIGIDYYPLISATQSEIEVRVNDFIPYFEASQIRLDKYYRFVNNENSIDRFGNDIAIKQVEIQKWFTTSLRDSSRLFDSPLKFYLKSGNNKITISKIDGAFLLGNITIDAPKKITPYDEYKQKYTDNSDGLFKELIEAENYAYSNDASLVISSSNDASVTPFSLNRLKLNVVNDFLTSGQEITYKVNVNKSGYYYLSLKVLQSNKYQTVYRYIKINGEIPFDEAKHLPLSYLSDWKYQTISNLKGNKLGFYLKEGENEISIGIDSSLFRVVSSNLQQMIDEINQFGLDIRSVTGNVVDIDIDWDLKEYFPTIDNDFNRWINNLNEIITYYENLSGFEEDDIQTSDFKLALRKLKILANDVNQIPKRQTLLSTGPSSVSQILGNAMINILQQPASFDSFFIHGKDFKLPSASKNLFDKTIIGIQRFFLTFFDNPYARKASSNELTIWVNRSRQYVDILQKLADDDFYRKHNIRVNISLMQDEGKLLLANSANQQPDLALGVSSWIPNEYGSRGAILDLRTFSDFKEVLDYYLDEQLIPLIYDNKLYGLPETSNFFVLYYRKDILNKLSLNVPTTWDDVVKMLPTLHRFGMNFYIPFSNNSSLKSFDTTAPFIYQFGGNIYSGEGFYANINEESTIKALGFISDLYKEYNLPLQVSSFFNEFRYNRIPIGISDMGMYLQLINAASEISGLWDIDLVPGVMIDGVINRQMGGAQQASMIFNKSNKKDQAWKFLKWWMEKDTQIEFASSLTQTYGKRYLWNSANIEAFKSLKIKESHKTTILAQWDSLKEVPKVPGSYIIEREISNILNNVIYNDANLRSSVNDSLLKMNKELNRKMYDFGYLNKNGEIIKEYMVPSKRTVSNWRDE